MKKSQNDTDIAHVVEGSLLIMIERHDMMYMYCTYICLPIVFVPNVFDVL